MWFIARVGPSWTACYPTSPGETGPRSLDCGRRDQSRVQRESASRNENVFPKATPSKSEPIPNQLNAPDQGPVSYQPL